MPALLLMTLGLLVIFTYAVITVFDEFIRRSKKSNVSFVLFIVVVQGLVYLKSCHCYPYPLLLHANQDPI